MSIDPKTLPNASCAFGDSQSGKTRWLVQRAQELAGRQAGPVLVLCASDWLAQEFARRLRKALHDVRATEGAGAVPRGPVQAIGEDAKWLAARGVTVTTPSRCTRAIVSDPAAQALTGRTGRVLEPYEEQVFFEDMRTTSMKGRRLREMLGFLGRELGELHDEDDWQATFEERQVLAYARRLLTFTGGILPDELAGLALRALQGCAALQEAWRFSHVLVDDYSELSRGMQVLSTRLAESSIAIAADKNGSSGSCSAHSYPAGIDELLAANPQASISQLEPRDAAATKATACAGMGDELREIARIVQEARKRGETALVCGTNRIWRANVQRALASVGLEPHAPRPTLRVRDFGDPKATARAQADARARLVENPHDGVAWRSVLGIGDYVARSDALQELREASEPLGLGIEESLEALAKGELEGIDPQERSIADLLTAYREAKGALTSAAWAAEAQAASKASGRRPWQEAPVIVADPRDCFGVQPDRVVFGGFVNGLIPSRDYFDPSKLIGGKRERELERCRQSVALAMGRARRQIVFTYFEQASLEAAEHLGLRIERIALRDGVRMCALTPSIFLDELSLASNPQT